MLLNTVFPLVILKCTSTTRTCLNSKRYVQLCTQHLYLCNQGLNTSSKLPSTPSPQQALMVPIIPLHKQKPRTKFWLSFSHSKSNNPRPVYFPSVVVVKWHIMSYSSVIPWIGTFQARRLGWAPISLLQGIFPTQGSKPQVSYIAGAFFYCWATREVHFPHNALRSACAHSVASVVSNSLQPHGL